MTADSDDMTKVPIRAADRAAPIATRAPAPRPRRLSRRAIALAAGGSAIGLAATLGLTLSSGRHRTAPQETVAVDHRQPTDLLQTAPKDYAAVARSQAAALGPPPSSVSPPGSSAVPTPGAVSTEASAQGRLDNEQIAALQHERQQRDSARSSKLFASSGDVGRPPQASEAGSPPAIVRSDVADAPSASSGADAQDRKAAFVAGGARASTINSGRLTAADGPHVVMAGATIAAALITGLSSDLPGEIVAQVTEDVFDSVSGRTKLIPQGTRLIGSYDARVSYGQSRALVIWNRLILPDGRSLELDRLIGTDTAGQSGFVDQVNRHTGKLLAAALLSSLVGVGSRVATGGGDTNDIAMAIRDSAGQSVGRAGDKLFEHQLDLQPTITVRPGARVRVLVSRDLVLEPWFAAISDPAGRRSQQIAGE